MRVPALRRRLADTRSLRTGMDEAVAALGSSLDVEQQPAADALADLGARLGGRRRPRGLYLHGPVGRGKTWLVDVVLAQLPSDRLLRVHAYDAARRLHREVARQAGSPGAVDRALATLLHDVDLLFLDELHAHDPGDAMLLSRLVRAVSEHRAVLVATSNYPPAGLLPDPRYHHLVLPLVAELERSCRVLAVDGPVDHRRHGRGGARPGWSSGAWLTPGSASQLAAAGLAEPGVGDGVRLTVGGRPLQVRGAASGAVWLEFAALCGGSTSAGDVLELAERFATVVLTGVPALSTVGADEARRFADLVDVLWDRDVRLIVTAGQAPGDTLDTVVRDGERTASRLALLPQQ